MGEGVGRGRGWGGGIEGAGALAVRDSLFGCAGTAGVGTGIDGPGSGSSLTIFGGLLLLGI